MSLFSRLFEGHRKQAKPRVRVCVECGMPVDDHKAWCTIRQGWLDMERQRAEKAKASSS